MDKRGIASFFIGLLFAAILVFPVSTVIAEQSGGSPESGAVSRVKSIYDSLGSLDYGSDTAGGWGDWGSLWNRIKSAAEWTPDGTAQASDVVNGKTFFSNSRELVTGTAPTPVDYMEQQFDEYDDYEGPGGNGELTDDYKGEESLWTNTSANVWKDERTGIYWSAKLGNYTNGFPNQNHSACDFFNRTENPTRGDYETSDPNISCGNAINACANLSLDADGDGNPETNWYLPTRKEFLQAYIDGIINQTGGTAFITWDFFWSSTENSWQSGNAWGTSMWIFYESDYPKGNSYSVRCVRSS